MAKRMYRVLRAFTDGGRLVRVGEIIQREESIAAGAVKRGLLLRLHSGGRGKKNLDKSAPVPGE